MASAVVGLDESGCYCNKKLDWAWIAHAVYFILLFRGSGRSAKELEYRFRDALDRMVAVKLKIKLKNSGCFRSELGADAFMELHSIVETTKKHDNSPFQAILALFGA